MLEELRITGLGVIEDATLPLGPGLTVITGETGAGKTMVVAGLGLLFGGRADAGRVRADPGRALVEGRLRLRGRSGIAVRGRIADLGAEQDEDGTLMLSRTVTAEGRSALLWGAGRFPPRCWVISASMLLAVHGQSDQLRLLRPGPATGCAGPIRRSGAREAAGAFAECFEQLAGLPRRSWPIVARTRRPGDQEAQLLRLGLDEINRVDPQPGEDEALRERLQRLEHVEGLRAAAKLRTTRCWAVVLPRRPTSTSGRGDPARHRWPGLEGPGRGGPGAGGARRAAGGDHDPGRRRGGGTVWLP